MTEELTSGNYIQAVSEFSDTAADDRREKTITKSRRPHINAFREGRDFQIGLKYIEIGDRR